MQEPQSIELRTVSSDKISEKEMRDLIAFCNEAIKDKKLDLKNWSVENWQNSPHSLLYCLCKERRFSEDRGLFYMLYAGGRLQAISGVYRSDWAPNEIAIGGVRTCTLPRARSSSIAVHGGFYHGDHIMPAQVEWARSKGLKAFILTFNETNLWLAKFILRIHQGRSVLLGYKLTDKARELYQDFYLYPKKLIIKNTLQWVLVKKLDEDFVFSEEALLSIKGQENDSAFDKVYASELKDFPIYSN